MSSQVGQYLTNSTASVLIDYPGLSSTATNTQALCAARAKYEFPRDETRPAKLPARSQAGHSQQLSTSRSYSSSSLRDFARFRDLPATNRSVPPGRKIVPKPAARRQPMESTELAPLAKAIEMVRGEPTPRMCNIDVGKARRRSRMVTLRVWRAAAALSSLRPLRRKSGTRPPKQTQRGSGSTVRTAVQLSSTSSKEMPCTTGAKRR